MKAWNKETQFVLKCMASDCVCHFNGTRKDKRQLKENDLILPAPMETGITRGSATQPVLQKNRARHKGSFSRQNLRNLSVLKDLLDEWSIVNCCLYRSFRVEVVGIVEVREMTKVVVLILWIF